MADHDYLFPRRMDRRELLKRAGFTAAGLAAGRAATAQETAPVRIGTGKWTYTLDEKWGTLPGEMKYGLGCAIVVDSKDRIYVTSRSNNPCVAVFNRRGDLLETWSNDFAEKIGYSPDQVAGTAHGLYWSKEGKDEFFYFTENTVRTNDIGARVYKTDLKGKVLYQLGRVAQASSTAQKFDFRNPTDVAVAPNGDLYIVDGYGSQLVHRFDKNFKHLKTIGGPGTEHGQFRTCHGVWVSTLNAEPEVYIADRANNRLEVYSPELDYKRTVPDMRLPCCFYQAKGHLYVPELGARVSILDAKDLVVARLGDGSAVKKEEIQNHPHLFAAPHAMCVDSKGDFYILEWLPYGRVRKFKHTPA